VDEAVRLVGTRRVVVQAPGERERARGEDAGSGRRRVAHGIRVSGLVAAAVEMEEDGQLVPTGALRRLGAWNVVGLAADDPLDDVAGLDPGAREPWVADRPGLHGVVRRREVEAAGLELDAEQRALVARRDELAEHRRLQRRIRLGIVRRLV